MATLIDPASYIKGDLSEVDAKISENVRLNESVRSTIEKQAEYAARMYREFFKIKEKSVWDSL